MEGSRKCRRDSKAFVHVAGMWERYERAFERGFPARGLLFKETIFRGDKSPIFFRADQRRSEAVEFGYLENQCSGVIRDKNGYG